MSLDNGQRIGAQEPRIKLVPSYAYTYGGDASALASGYGLSPDPWQADILDAWFGCDKYGKYVSPTCGLLVPRQNGKNALIEVRELFGATILGEKILHTAHEVKTARKAFERICSFFENERQYPELAEMVKAIRRTNGQEAIVLTNGGSIEFSARSKSAGRGFTVDVVICDEAQEITDEQLEAIMSTKSAAPLGNSQVIFVGTPPGYSTSGEVFKRTRESAIRKERNLSWHEWSIKECKDISNRDLWYETNPALGIRIKESDVESEFRTMSADGFARERLGWWPSLAGSRILTEAMWNPLATANPNLDGKLAYGIKFSIDGKTVSLCVAVKPKEGRRYVGCIEHRSTDHGTAWLANWLLERQSKAAVVVIDGKSGAGALVERLKQEKFPPKALIQPQPREVATAASFLLDAIKEEQIQHYDQPALNNSALYAQKRKIGQDGSWGWGGSGEVDSTPIEACSLAYWGVMTTKRNPSRKAKVH